MDQIFIKLNSSKFQNFKIVLLLTINSEEKIKRVKRSF